MTTDNTKISFKMSKTKSINLNEVVAAGFDFNTVHIGHCPECNSSRTAHIFTNGEEYILACPKCGFRARASHTSTYFKQWLDAELKLLDCLRGRAKLPLVKKSITMRKYSASAMKYK